jgi:hypothetical protein
MTDYVKFLIDSLILVGIGAGLIFTFFISSILFSSFVRIVVTILIYCNQNCGSWSKDLEAKVILITKIFFFWVEKLVYLFAIVIVYFFTMDLIGVLGQQFLTYSVIWFIVGRVGFYFSYHVKIHLEALRSAIKIGNVIKINGVKGRIIEISIEYILLRPIYTKIFSGPLEMSKYVLMSRIDDDDGIKKQKVDIQKWKVESKTKTERIPFDDLIHRTTTFYH